MCGSGENTQHDLRIAARDFPGVRVHESRWHPTLAASAQKNSDRCCYLGRGGHHNWDSRFQDLIKTGLGKTFGEINAGSWKHQESLNPVELWTEAFRCWRQSKGHWSVASAPHVYYGAGLAKSKGGIWFMSIIVADGVGAPPADTEPEGYKLW